MADVTVIEFRVVIKDANGFCTSYAFDPAADLTAAGTLKNAAVKRLTKQFGDEVKARDDDAKAARLARQAMTREQRRAERVALRAALAEQAAVVESQVSAIDAEDAADADRVGG